MKIIFFILCFLTISQYSVSGTVKDKEIDVFFRTTTGILSDRDIEKILGHYCDRIYTAIYGHNYDDFSSQNKSCKVFLKYDKNNIDITSINDKIFLISSAFFIPDKDGKYTDLYLHTGLLKLMLMYDIASRVLQRNPNIQYDYNQTNSADGSFASEQGYIFLEDRTIDNVNFLKSFFKNSTNLDLFFLNKEFFDERLTKVKQTSVSKEEIKQVQYIISNRKEKFFIKDNYNNMGLGFADSSNFTADKTISQPININRYMQYLCTRGRNCIFLRKAYHKLSFAIINDEELLSKMARFINKYPDFILNTELSDLLNVSQDYFNDLYREEDDIAFLFTSQKLNFILNDKYNILDHNAENIRVQDNSHAFDNPGLIHSTNINFEEIYQKPFVQSELKKYYDLYSNILSLQEDKKDKKDQAIIDFIRNFTPIRMQIDNDTTNYNENNLTTISYPAMSSTNEDFLNIINLSNDISSLKIIINDLLINNNNYISDYLNFVFNYGNRQFVFLFYQTLRYLKDKNLILHKEYGRGYNELHARIKQITDSNMSINYDDLYLNIFLIFLMRDGNDQCGAMQKEFLLLQNSFEDTHTMCEFIDKINKVCTFNINDFSFLNAKQQCLFMKQQANSFPRN